MPQTIRAFAPAKVNLSLKVRGRRADGYHELTSLVAFADVGDTLTLAPSQTFSLQVTGPMAKRIDGPNLIEKAACELVAICPAICPGDITLHKVLPVGAGIGGGSSDVAAYIRAVRQANAADAEAIDWPAFALSLGADVPVCLTGNATWMRGVGESLSRTHLPPELCHAVLVNPAISVPTGAVFRELDAPQIADADPAPMPSLLPAPDRLLMERLSNDLAPPALRLHPEIAAARDALETTSNVKAVRMSGSGATFFGLYETRGSAQAAADKLASEHPDWWVVATVLGDAPADDAAVF